jgi:diguanylate cyclase (GGDEF)-like protein
LAIGEQIFRKGEAGDTMYIVEHGAIDIFFEDGRTAKRLGPGEFFGELSLLTGNHRRTGTAVAADETRLRVVDQAAFERFLSSSPPTAVQLLRRTCSYLLDSEQRLVSDLVSRNRELEHALDFLRRTKEDLDTTQLETLTDELTGLYNRRCLKRQSEVLLASSGSGLSQLSLMLIDIDRFKQVNDTHGYPVGDLILCRFADVLRDTLRQTDLPCRLGGNEFSVLLVHQDEDEARGMARRLLERISELSIEVPAGEVRITCSIGGCAHREDEPWAAFFERTDQNLYRAKEGGRNRVCWDGEIIAQGRTT